MQIDVLSALQRTNARKYRCQQISVKLAGRRRQRFEKSEYDSRLLFYLH
jgi:hypothetical protein